MRNKKFKYQNDLKIDIDTESKRIYTNRTINESVKCLETIFFGYEYSP